MMRKPKLEITLQWIDRLPNGKTVKRRKQKCRSYVIGMIDMLAGMTSFASVAPSIKDTAGVSHAYATSQFNLTLDAAAGDATLGVLVGTGTNAVTISNYTLQTPIANGVGANQLQYGIVSFVLPSTVDSTRQFTVSRTFTNNSGASITVNEVGLVCRQGGTPYKVLIERSLSTKAILNGASATAVYTLGVTV